MLVSVGKSAGLKFKMRASCVQCDISGLDSFLRMFVCMGASRVSTQFKSTFLSKSFLFALIEGIQQVHRMIGMDNFGCALDYG